MNKISASNHFAKRLIYFLSPLLVIGIVSRAFPGLNSLYYIVPVVLLICLIFGLYLRIYKKLSLRSAVIIFAFPVYTLITSIWSLYPLITFQRSFFLIIIYTGILTLVLLLKRYSSEYSLSFFIPANIFIIILSLTALIINTSSENWSGGNGLGFLGFAGHQNILAAALLFTIPGIFALVNSDQILQQAQDDKTRRKKNISNILFWILITANCLLLTVTYSRASILALVAGTIVFLILNKSKKILAYTITAAALFVVLYFAVSSIQSTANQLINKDGGRILGRRMILWEPSIEAAKQGGIFGLGYGVSAPEIKTPLSTGSHYEDGRYIREKGNSVLAVVEETGVLGLLLFLLPLFYIALKLFSNRNQLHTAHYSLVTSVLIAMLVHSQFEAWWVGVGSVSLPLFLIVLFTLIISGENIDVISNKCEKS